MRLEVGARLIFAVLALLLGLVPPVHAGPPVVGPQEVQLPAAPADQPSPVVQVFLVAYRSQGPPVVLVRATSSRSAWCIQYAYCDGDPVNKVDPTGLRAIVAADAWPEFDKWWRANLTLNGNDPGRQIGFGFPSGNEGAYTTWGGLGPVESKYWEASIVGQVDVSKLNQKDMAFLGAILDPNNTYVFDAPGHLPHAHAAS